MGSFGVTPHCCPVVRRAKNGKRGIPLNKKSHVCNRKNTWRAAEMVVFGLLWDKNNLSGIKASKRT
jgi:hypothetical protein